MKKKKLNLPRAFRLVARIGLGFATTVTFFLFLSWPDWMTNCQSVTQQHLMIKSFAPTKILFIFHPHYNSKNRKNDRNMYNLDIHHWKREREPSPPSPSPVQLSNNRRRVVKSGTKKMTYMIDHSWALCELHLPTTRNINWGFRWSLLWWWWWSTLVIWMGDISAMKKIPPSYCIYESTITASICSNYFVWYIYIVPMAISDSDDSYLVVSDGDSLVRKSPHVIVCAKIN